LSNYFLDTISWCLYPRTVLTYYFNRFPVSALPTEVKSDDNDDFFSYVKLQDISSLSPLAVQLDYYLSSVSTSVACLASSTCDDAFIKANLTLKSLAAVERHCSAQLDRSCSVAGTASCPTNISKCFCFCRALKVWTVNRAQQARQPFWRTIWCLCL